MTGGLHSSRQRRRDRSLAERVETGEADVAPATPKPCWLAPHDQPLPSHVIGWVPGPGGTWRAIVLLEVAAADVAPRPAPDDAPDP